MNSKSHITLVILILWFKHVIQHYVLIDIYTLMNVIIWFSVLILLKQDRISRKSQMGNQSPSSDSFLIRSDWLAVSFLGTSTNMRTNWSPRPSPLRWGAPNPFMRTFVLLWVPAGIFSLFVPALRVGTSIVEPRQAWEKLTVFSTYRSSPSLEKMGCGNTWMLR